MKKKAKIIITVICILVLCALCAFMVYSVLHIVRNADIETGETDPMFETPAEQVTRPPELDAEETQPPHGTLDDYIDENQTAVDKTAEELAKEAQTSAEQSR